MPNRIKFAYKSLAWVLVILSTGILYTSARSQEITPFTEEAVERGLVYTMQNPELIQGHLGFGCGFADLDNDGDQDAVIIGASDGRVGIFENDGTGNFNDHSLQSGIPLLAEATGFVAFDYDGDSDIDLYFTQIGLANVLARNDGNFRFIDVADEANVDDPGDSESASAADYDGDGWLDLYVCNYSGLTTDIKNKLYKNLGNGRFQDVSVEQTVDDHGFSFQSVWFDYDRDGDVDLYLSNDRALRSPFRSNQLWRNDDGQLVNVSVGSGADVSIYSMGVAAGDFDGNGFPDVYVTNIENYEEGWNPLLLNQGDGTFVEDCLGAGVCDFITSWGSIFFDFDNDSHMDLYVNNMFKPNVLFDCNGSFPCEEVASTAEVTAVRAKSLTRLAIDDDPEELTKEQSFSSAVADVDNDGDMDLLVNNLAGNVQLFINNEGQKRNWIRYRMVGQGGNIFTVGGNIDTRVGDKWQYREIYAGGNSYLGMNELIIHVGLDDATLVNEAHVKWPGGNTTRTLTNLPVNQTWTIYPPEMLGDADLDGTVRLEDFVVLSSCSRSSFTPGCEIMDLNSDSSVDLNDFSAFLDSYDDMPADCDNNGILDMREILLDQSLDQNSDGALDQCRSTMGGEGSGGGGGCSLTSSTAIGIEKNWANSIIILITLLLVSLRKIRREIGRNV